ncbi:MAG: hypothetical protein KAJ10_10635, partial [Thermodesulfovibrionia bacterium]|nr:hypothetical protein [Thermodesulfovibrionia bacterium]
MNEKKSRCVLISDFNVDIFSGYLGNDVDLPAVDTTVAPFGQVVPLLMQEDLEYWKGNLDFIVIWTRPEAVIESFNNLLACKNPPINDILDEVNHFASLILNICDKMKSVFIPTWVLPPFFRGFGMLDMKKDFGIANTLMQMNLRLADKFAHFSNVFLLDVQRWISAAGKYAYNPRLWYRGKIAFGNDVYKEAV